MSYLLFSLGVGAFVVVVFALRLLKFLLRDTAASENTSRDSGPDMAHGCAVDIRTGQVFGQHKPIR